MHKGMEIVLRTVTSLGRQGHGGTGEESGGLAKARSQWILSAILHNWNQCCGHGGMMDPERIRAALQLESSDRAGGWIGGTGLEEGCQV